MVKKKRYIRKGECLQCGKCCLTENCEHLSVKDGKAFCLIHDDPDYPIKCKLHPQGPPILIEGCGYYFYDTIDKRKAGVHEV